ncbi:uncharacterized protein LOC128179497 isoform X1 [Crassostrea angulata]|uniref:uncharacterized protein LOC128179497 isoform X1 n=1 Tax=Magallana angulata TaxID=2784310 RepID=UPI0022B099C1|nr:uncharacterized protein LOC128179497 isoform X1 [Crassostrea angulata]
MTVSGNLRQWPELGENGEAGIGHIKSNETFQLATNFLLETGKSACASFFYRREKTGSTLKFFYTTSGLRRSLWESVQDVSINNTWKQVKIDLLGIQYLGNVVLTLEGNTTPSSGYLDIDNVLIVDLACSLVNF